MFEPSDKEKDTARQLKQAILEWTENKTDSQRILQIMGLFRQGTFAVPVTVILSEKDREMFMNVKEGDTVTTRDDIRMRPDYLKNAEGALFYPAFTSKEETEPSYRDSFSWIPMSGLQIINAARSGKNLSGVVINGFTQAFVLNRKMLDLLANAATVPHKITKGTAVTFGRVNHSHMAMRKAAEEYLRKNTAVKKAFFAVMSENGKKESYVFIIESDLPRERFRLLINTLNELVQKTHPDMPVDYAPYPAMKEQLMAGGMQPFYSSAGFHHKKLCVPMEDSRTFFITAYTDDEGWDCGYSFDFEYADDYHYDISGDEAMRLVKKLQFELKTQETRLIVLVHDYLGDALQDPKKTDKKLLDMFGRMDVEYRSFHY